MASLMEYLRELKAQPDLGPLLILSMVLLSGLVGGAAAKRLHIPSITGNILAGAILGLTLLKGTDAAYTLQPLSTFAIGLIAVSAGGHFSYRRVHNALRRIITITFCETALGFGCVFTIVMLLGLEWYVALIMAALSAEVAPATTMALVRENRAKGPFVKTLMTTVSLNTSLCIVLFAFARSLVADYFVLGADEGFRLLPTLGHTAYQLVGAAVIGLMLGWVVDKLVNRPAFHHFSTVFVSILVAIGLSQFLGLSPLLTCLVIGGYLGNASPEGERQLNALAPLELLLYTLFFTLAGVGIHLDALGKTEFTLPLFDRLGWGIGAFYAAVVLMLAYVAARAGGKAIGSMIGGILSKTSPRIWKSMPWAVMPQAGVVIGLVVILEGDTRFPAEVRNLMGTVILAAVTLNEILGPLLTRIALKRSREVGLDRPRLMEFLQEEFILAHLEAEDKWDAIKQLTSFFLRTHRVDAIARRTLEHTVIERERSMSTAVGSGAALPHGRIQHGPGVQGVLGISRKGIDWDTPDGEPVRIVVLIVTPKDHDKQHLEVLASLSTMISNDTIRTRLMSAMDANDAWEVIEAEEAPNFNYFFETDEDNPARQGR